MPRRILPLLTSLLITTLSACSASSTPDANDDTGRESSGPSGSSIDLGTVASGADVTFEVPEGTVGFTIVADATVSQDDFIGVEELRDPSGNVVVADFRNPKDAASRAVTGPSGAGVGVLVFPLIGDGAGTAPRAGRWTAKLGGSTLVKGAAKGTVTPWSGRVHGVVLLQASRDGAFHGGALDLDLYVPDGLRVFDESASRTVDAASAPRDAAISERLDLVFALYRRLYDLERGEVRFHAVASSVAAIDGQAAIDQANTLATARPRRPAAQVILTNRLAPEGTGKGGGGAEISGIANCLPGAVGVASTKCSAVIVSLRGGPAWEDAATMVHELGHFIGLEHTTEFGGGGDTLSDTPLCTSTEKADLAQCPDFDNLMFPTSSVASAERNVVVSPTQRRIMQSSPIYRAAP